MTLIITIQQFVVNNDTEPFPSLHKSLLAHVPCKVTGAEHRKAGPGSSRYREQTKCFDIRPYIYTAYSTQRAIRRFTTVSLHVYAEP